MVSCIARFQDNHLLTAVMVTISEAEIKKGDTAWDPTVHQSPSEEETVTSAYTVFDQILR